MTRLIPFRWLIYLILLIDQPVNEMKSENEVGTFTDGNRDVKLWTEFLESSGMDEQFLPMNSASMRYTPRDFHNELRRYVLMFLRLLTYTDTFRALAPNVRREPLARRFL